MAKKYRLRLSAVEREELEGLLRKGRRSAQVQRHARILLHADENQPGGGWSDERIAAAVGAAVSTVQRVRQVSVEHGLVHALERKPADRVYPRRLDGAGEAQLVRLACGEAPAGRARWTLRLLADKLVALDVVESISHEAVRQTLKKTICSPGGNASG